MMRPDPELPAVYLCVEPVDFRKAIQGLSLLVEQELELNPFEATLFVFINRRRDKLKILYWEKNGFCLWYKRLEKQRYKEGWIYLAVIDLYSRRVAGWSMVSS